MYHWKRERVLSRSTYAHSLCKPSRLPGMTEVHTFASQSRAASLRWALKLWSLKLEISIWRQTTVVFSDVDFKFWFRQRSPKITDFRFGDEEVTWLHYYSWPGARSWFWILFPISSLIPASYNGIYIVYVISLWHLHSRRLKRFHKLVTAFLRNRRIWPIFPLRWVVSYRCVLRIHFSRIWAGC